MPPIDTDRDGYPDSRGGQHRRPLGWYGLPLVAACAEAGTDYADLTGEAPVVRHSIDLYHKQPR
jgi:hypothetical protein